MRKSCVCVDVNKIFKAEMQQDSVTIARIEGDTVGLLSG